MPRLRAATLFLTAAFVAACGSAASSGLPPAATAPAQGVASAEPDPGGAGSSAGPGRTEAPVAPAAPTDAGTDDPGEPEPAESAAASIPPPSVPPSVPPSGSGAPSPTGGTAAACSGSDANREFFANVGAAVDWPVLCAVLPEGWFVSTGSYRLAGGGKLEIAYTGPGGASLVLSEGAFCADAGGCVPAGTDAGAASLGGREAVLVRLDDGGYAVVADRGANPSWLLVARDIDEARAVALGAALAEVAD